MEQEVTKLQISMFFLQIWVVLIKRRKPALRSLGASSDCDRLLAARCHITGNCEETKIVIVPITNNTSTKMHKYSWKQYKYRIQRRTNTVGARRPLARCGGQINPIHCQQHNRI